MNPPSTLAQALDALRSADVLLQNEGVTLVVSLGTAAVPALLGLLNDPAAARAQVMYALAQLADPRAHPAFQAALTDADENVRAQAAAGLARSGHPNGLPALLQTLNDAPDLLHLDRTPAVDALPAFGLAAAPALLDRMADADTMTRLHAQRAFEGVVARLGAAAPAGSAYAYDADESLRAAALQRWRAWLAQQRR